MARNAPAAPVPSMEGRTVVITGGNSGIGLETSVALAGAGARMVLGCRNPTKAAAAVDEIRRRSGNDAVESRTLDLADLDSVRRFAAGLSDLDHIDVLLNNAGLILGERTESAQGYEATFATNHLGPFLLTNLLGDQLRAAGSARIVNVASFAHMMAPTGIRWSAVEHRPRYQGWSVYGQSKLANILHARALATRYEGTDVVAHSLHPGSIRSGFGQDGDLHGFSDRLLKVGAFVLITPEQGSRTSVHVASSPDALTSSGDYWVRSRRGRPAPWARDDAQAEKLWAVSERMISAVS